MWNMNVFLYLIQIIFSLLTAWLFISCFFHRTKDSNLGVNQFIEVVLLWVLFWFHVQEYPALVLKS